MKSRPEKVSVVLLAISFLIGAVGFGVGIAGTAPLRAWEAFLVNLLFWTGLAQGGVVMSAALYLSQARWGGAALYRLAEAAVGFLPIGFLLFWVLLAGRYWIFPWLIHPIQAKTGYLNIPFLFTRDGVGLLAMWLLSRVFVRFSRRQEVVAWAEDYDSLSEAPLAVRRLAPVLAISFALIYSILAVDLVMSLSPQWYSTMFGAYFAFGAFLSAIMAMALAAAAGKRPVRSDTAGERGGVLHDLGKLVFAGSTFWAYLVFSMYLVIWYGDIPKTTFFVAVRVNYPPWNLVGWGSLCLVWAVPFILLMTRTAKRNPVVLGTVSFASLIGFWMERYVLVAPSLSPRHIPFGWIEIVVTLGFLGLFGLATKSGLDRVVPTADSQARRDAA
jgi:hypothetical protein